MTASAVGISKRDILTFVLKWKGTIIGGTLFIVLLAALLAYLLPQVYVATAKIVVDSTRSPNLRASYAAGLESVEVLNNEIQIMRSRSVMTAVVDEVRPHERPSRDSKTKRMIEEFKQWLSDKGLLANLERRQAWIESLLRTVEAEAVTNSTVVQIAYRDEEPEWAQKIANAVTDQYLSRHVQVYASEGVTSFYQEQLANAETQLGRLRQELLDYKQRFSALAVNDRLPELVREMTKMRADVSEARAEYDQLLTRYERSHPQVRLTQGRLNDLRAAESETSRQLAALERQQSDIEALEVEVRSQENTYLDLKRNYEKARLNAASNADTINVRLLEYAELPVKPQFSRLLILFLSIPLGLAVAISVALLREYMDHRVNDPDTAESVLALPCLGSVPRYGLLRRRGLALATGTPAT